jgi:polar amino acid transport system substrate-binding protein
VLAALQELFDNVTYAMVIKKWGLERNMLKKPGINLAPDTDHFKTK